MSLKKSYILKLVLAASAGGFTEIQKAKKRKKNG